MAGWDKRKEDKGACTNMGKLSPLTSTELDKNGFGSVTPSVGLRVDRRKHLKLKDISDTLVMSAERLAYVQVSISIQA